MISVERLKKTYGNIRAVDDLSFEVALGRVTGFLGPNGAGKSTTMRLMLGLDRGAGVTTYDGKRLRDYSRPSQVVGILLEAKAFHPTRKARNHLRVLATAGDIPVPEWPKPSTPLACATRETEAGQVQPRYESATRHRCRGPR